MAKNYAPGWRISKPDVVFELPEEVSIPATGAIDYQYISVPTHFTEDKWVEMAEVRPGNRTLVHHAIVMVDEVGDGEGQEYLGGYAPGMTPQIWKPGQARLVRAGTTLVFQMHYTTNGKPGKDRTKIGLVFAKHPPAERIGSMEVMAPWMVLPPNDANIRIAAATTLREPVRLMGIRPHMHFAREIRSRCARCIQAARPKCCSTCRSSTSTISLIITWRVRSCCRAGRGSSVSRCTTTRRTILGIRIRRRRLLGGRRRGTR